MTYALTFDRKPAYLHATVTGPNSRDNVMRYMAEVLRECQARACRRVLIEERLDGPRLPMLDVFQIVTEGSGDAGGLLDAIGYVDVNAEGDLMRFAETVAVNRALPVAVFGSVAEAERWLQQESPAGAGPGRRQAP